MRFNKEDLHKLDNGKAVRADNGKRYAHCQICGKLVCLDKKLFHSLHLCAER
jgi:hypothetical protein